MKKKKYIIGALALVLCMSLGLFVGSKIAGENSEYKEVMAMMDSNASNQEKIMFLEKRYTGEMAVLDLLLSHSDLCSSRYLNELSTLSISFEATRDGYEKLGEEVNYSDYKNINEKINDYYDLIESFDEMYENINDENYVDAITNLDEIEDIRDNVYANVEKEISEVK